MTHDPAAVCTAFADHQKIAHGPLHQIATMVGGRDGVLVFNDKTGQVIDVDPRGYPEPVESKRGPGRPKLGVIPREVTLLKRHWDWLGQQPGGASAALRRLVDDARRSDSGVTDARVAREASYQFISALAGDLPGYEEATRALFAADLDGFAAQMVAWPADIQAYALALTEGPGDAMP